MSTRCVTFVDLQNGSPVIVVPAMTFVSEAPAPKKFGPPESPLQVPLSPVAGFCERRR